VDNVKKPGPLVAKSSEMLLASLLKEMLNEKGMALKFPRALPVSELNNPTVGITSKPSGSPLEEKVAVKPLEIIANGVSRSPVFSKLYSESALAMPTIPQVKKKTRTTARESLSMGHLLCAGHTEHAATYGGLLGVMHKRDLRPGLEIRKQCVA
jgi:hypothetical protein